MLKKNPIYIKWENTAWTSVTLANLETDLDAITMTSLENLPLIQYLTALHQYKMAEKKYAQRAIYANPLATAYQPAYTTPTELDDFDSHLSSATLASGAITDEAIYAPGAGYKFCAFWILTGGDNQTNPSTTIYDMLFEEETTSQFYQRIFHPQTDFGKHHIGLHAVGTTADKDLDMTIDDGVGTEKIYIRTIGGKFA